MPLDFPSSATTGSIYTGTNGVLYTYDGVKWVGSSPQGSIIPSANLTYDLGSTSSQWRHLYVGTSTIYIGGTPVTVGPGGQLNVNGSPVTGGGGLASTSTLVNGTYTVQLLVGGAGPYVSFPEDDGSKIEIQGTDIGGIGSFPLSLMSTENSVMLSANATSIARKDWTFGTDGNLTLPGEIYGKQLTGFGGTPNGRAVNITPADNATDKKFKFRVDQYGETFTRAYLDMPTAQNDKQVAISFAHENNTVGYIFNQGANTNNDGLNNAFNIFYNAGDIKVTAMTTGTGVFKTWNFGQSGGLTFPNGTIQSSAWTGSTSTLANGTYTVQLLVGGGQPYVMFPQAYGTQLAIQGNEIAAQGTDTLVLSAGSGGNVQINTFNPAQTTWVFGTDSNLTFPDGTTSTGASVYVPYATSSSFKVTTEIETGPGSYFPVTFQVQGTKIVLPGGNGAIQAGSGIWNLDSGNKQFSFPNLSRINYGDGDYLSTGTLEVDVRDGGIFQIRLNDYNKTWTFNNSGDLNVPGTIRQGDNYLNLNSPGTGIILLSDTSTVKIIADYATNGGAAWTFESNLSFTAPNGGDIVFNSSTNSYIYGVTGIEFANATTQTTAWTKAAASVQSTPPSSPVTGQLYYDTDDGRTYIYTGAAWIDSSPASAAGVTSITAGTGTFVSSTTGNITIWNTGSVASVLKETFETKNASTGTTIHDCTTNRLFYLTNLGTNFTPNFTNLNLSSGDATSVSLVVLQTSTARSVTGVQIASTTSGVSLIWQGSITAPSGNASRTEVFSFSIMCTGTNAYTVLGMMTSFGGA